MSDKVFLHIEFWIFVVVLVGVFAFALAKGDRPEQLGGAFNVVAGLLGSAIGAVGSMLYNPFEPVLLLGIDAALAAGFLFLALRYASLWLGVALLLQAVQFSLHAFYLIGGMHHDRNYQVVNNLDSDGINLAIIYGTALAWRRRRRHQEVPQAQPGPVTI